MCSGEATSIEYGIKLELCVELLINNMIKIKLSDNTYSLIKYKTYEKTV